MFSGGPSLTARLANIKHMPVLITATVASDKPTDAYLIKDIVKMSFESSQMRAFLQQYLLNQLITSRNVHVKRKVLKLLEELLLKGHIEFKHNLRKQPEPLNEASRIKPPPGNSDGALNTDCVRIRDLANKVLEMLFSDAPELRKPQYPTPELKDAEEESMSSTRIEGFGNTGGKSTSKTEKLLSLFGSGSKANSSAPVVYDESYATMDPVPHNVGGSGGGVGGSGYSSGVSYTPGKYSDRGIPSGAPHRSGEAGGGWAGGETSYSRSRYTEQENTQSTSAEESEEVNTEQERRLVDDITAPGGIKAAPPRENLNLFISRCKVLDCLAVVEYLRRKLQQEDQQTQVVLRTLFVIEALLRSDIPDIYSFLDLILEELNSLTSSPNSSVRAKASKILHQLTAEASEKVAASTTTDHTSSSTAATASGDVSTSNSSEAILDLGGGGGAGDKAEEMEKLLEKEEPSQLPQSDMSGLFAGLSVSGKAPPTATPTAVVKPTHSLNKKPSPRAVKKEKSLKKVQIEKDSSCADILGLTVPNVTPTASTAALPKNSSQSTTTTTIADNDEASLLMDLEEDKDEFDPLKRTDSVGSKSNSLPRSSLLHNPNPNGAHLATPSSSSHGDSASVLTQFSGLDLSLSHPTSTAPGEVEESSESRQNAAAELLQPKVLRPAPPMAVTSTTPGLTLSQPMGVVVGGYGVPQVGVGGQVTYMPAGVAYGVHPTPGMAQPGMSMFPSAPAMVYMSQPRLGGDARPVQRPVGGEKSVLQISADSSFHFLDKSSKRSAFDFVKDEMDSAKKK